MLADGNPRYTEGSRPTIWLKNLSGFVTYDIESDKMSMLGASQADRKIVAGYKTGVTHA